MVEIISTAGIIGGFISFVSLVFRVVDTIRKIENNQDRKFAQIGERLSSLEGRLHTYDNLHQSDFESMKNL